PKNNIPFHTQHGITGLPILVEALQFFDNKNPRNYLIENIELFVNEHLKMYPQDTEYLMQYLNISK
ncbi:MAG: hypothetical protein IJ881_02200, partial [Neisseriaceae bacterium]|nr:hypothetical protein [Neisseriaceae bacterium]